MHNFLLQVFKTLSSDRQLMIWQLLVGTPIFTEFLIEVKAQIEKTYLDFPEPADFETPTMAGHLAEKRQLKSSINVINNLLAINNYMANK